MNLPIQAFNDDSEQMRVEDGSICSPGGSVLIGGIHILPPGYTDAETQAQAESLADWTNKHGSALTQP